MNPRYEAALTSEVTAVRSELTRVDAKATALLGLAGTALTLGAAAATVATLPAAVKITMAISALPLIAAVALLLLIVMPSLPRRDQGTGFIRYAGAANVADLLSAFDDDPAERLGADLKRLSFLTYTKFTRLQVAVRLLLATLAALSLTLLLGLLYLTNLI